MRRLVVLGLALAALAIGVLAAPRWLPSLGTALAVDEPIEPADVALVLDDSSRADATDSAEAWRRTGLVRDVVIVEAPVRTHALIAYWSDFVRWGLAEPSPTPSDHLRIVRAPSAQAAQQATAALPALQDYGAHLVLVPGGGGIGSRLVQRDLVSVLEPAGIGVRLVGRDVNHPPEDWFQYDPDRRAVLNSWLELFVPFLSDYEPGPGA